MESAWDYRHNTAGRLVFNTFGALAIAAESYGLKGAVSLRVIQNVFGVVFALVFCAVFYRFMSGKAPVKEETV